MEVKKETEEKEKATSFQTLKQCQGGPKIAMLAKQMSLATSGVAGFAKPGAGPNECSKLMAKIISMINLQVVPLQ